MGLLSQSVPTGAVFNGADQQGWDQLLSSRATTQAAVDTTRAEQQYSNVVLPGLNNAAAAAGDYYGGGRTHSIDLAGAQQANTLGDIQTKLGQYQTDMTMAGFLAKTGVSINMSGT